jgi:hypothetical protein
MNQFSTSFQGDIIDRTNVCGGDVSASRHMTEALRRYFDMDSLTHKCTACGKVKSKSEFSPDKRKPVGVQAKCKQCASAWMRQYRRDNPELIREGKKAYDATHREQRRNRIRKDYRKDPGKHKKWHRKWNAKNKNRIETTAKAWRESHPDNIQAFGLRRRQRKYSAGGNGVSGEKWIELKNDYMNRCVYCGKQVKLTLDHIQPLVDGGLHDIENAAPACKSCNSKKGIKSLLMFLYHQLVG